MILSFKAVIFVLGNVYITNLLKAGKNKNRHSGGSYQNAHNRSISSSHRRLTASEGILKSPRGDSVTVPTLGPSGRQERLNCCEKNRLKNTAIQFLINALSYTSSKALVARAINLFRCKSISYKIVKEKIMQFVGAYNILGYLRNLSIFRRNQFGRNGGL